MLVRTGKPHALNWSFGIALLTAACSADGATEGEEIERNQYALTVAEKQILANNFYDPSNLVTIRITMDATEWTNLKNEQPKSTTSDRSPCSAGVAAYTGSRYDQHPTQSVVIQTSTSPTAGGSFTVTAPTIKKKSWCGSISSTKPSFHLKLGAASGMESYVENLIGTQYLMLNNSIQDSSMVRQCLGNKLFKDAGIPYARCNFASVYVNNEHIGVYVNLEPLEKRFVQNNFNGNSSGNLYEFEFGEDFASNWVSRTDIKGFSDYENKADLNLAITRIAANDIPSVVDVDQFVRVWAMEILLKHWDGYASGANNAYVYNDTTAVSSPGVDNVNFKLIPSGIDQILQSNWDWSLYGNSVLASALLNDPAMLAKLRRQIFLYAGGVLGPKRLDAEVRPFAEALRGYANTLLTQAGAATIPYSEVNAINQQLLQIRPALNDLFGVGVPPDGTTIWLVGYNGDCVHRGPAVIGTDPKVGEAAQEIDHKACGTSQNYLFQFSSSSSKPGYYRLSYVVSGSDYAYGTKAGATFPTANGAYNVYYSKPGGSDDYAQYFGLIPYGDGRYEFQSVETGLCWHFSTAQTTADGNYDVYQAECDAAEKKLISLVGL